MSLESLDNTESSDQDISPVQSLQILSLELPGSNKVSNPNTLVENCDDIGGDPKSSISLFQNENFKSSNYENNFKTSENEPSYKITPIEIVKYQSPQPSRIKLWQNRCLNFIENEYYLIFSTILTLWTLFSTDIRLAATDKSADVAFTVILLMIFIVFVIEIFVTCFCKPEYFQLPTWEQKYGETFMETWYHRLTIGSFYFWLDLLATLSLLFEISFTFGDNLLISNSVASLMGQGLRTAARSVKIVRLLRFLRIAKLYKNYFMFQGKSNKVTETADDDGNNSKNQSHVGEKISELTTQRVIILVIVMLVIIPSLVLYDPDMSDSLAYTMFNDMAVLNATNSSYSSGLTYTTNYVIATTTVVEIQLAYQPNNLRTLYYDSVISTLRNIEQLTYSSSHSSPYVSSKMIFSLKSFVVQSASFSIIETIFVILVLLIATYFFSSDVNKLVITPIEYMVALVRKISDNPLRVDYKIAGEADGFHEGLETIILLSTITKIGGLMRVGFGEAGASVIAKNLAESSGGHLNLMGSGTMINSIFGFCDVRQFTDTTECLQEEVMLFVNRIAHILHGIVVQCSGQANKNIGDAFLLTWKVDENIAGTPSESVLADQALLAFVKTLIELIRHEIFICNFSPEATSRLYKRFPGYNVRIGCGLHYGWAIEGAIGSNRKIDASYLSPHVNFTEFLESSTKAYGVPLLMSESFYKRLSSSVNRYCRQVDRIKRVDDDDPVGLYTYDCDLTIDFSDNNRKRYAVVKGSRASAEKHSKLNKGASFRIKPGGIGLSRAKSKLGNVNSRDEEDDDLPAPNIAHQVGNSVTSLPSIVKYAPTIVMHPYVPRVWEKDEDLVEIRHMFTPLFKNVWTEAIESYLNGDWDISMEHLKECLKMTKGSDGPSKFLLGLIEDAGGKAPETWKGYRGEDDGH